MIDVISVWCIAAYLIHAGMWLKCYDSLPNSAKYGFIISFFLSPVSLFVIAGVVVAEKYT